MIGYVVGLVFVVVVISAMMITSTGIELRKQAGSFGSNGLRKQQPESYRCSCKYSNRCTSKSKDNCINCSNNYRLYEKKSFYSEV